jgi:hypothetical protein
MMSFILKAPLFIVTLLLSRLYSGKEAPCDGHSLGKRHGPILDHLLWSGHAAAHP